MNMGGHLLSDKKSGSLSFNKLPDKLVVFYMPSICQSILA